MRTIGVSPMASRMVAQIFFTIQVYTAATHASRAAEASRSARRAAATRDLDAATHRAPAVVAAAGTKPKRIEEFAGRVNSGHAQVSVARMTSPAGWQEPGQRPEFEEITVVLRGMVRVEHDGGAIDVRAGQAVVTAPASGSATARPTPTARNTSPSACRRSRRPPFIATATVNLSNGVIE